MTSLLRTLCNTSVRDVTWHGMTRASFNYAENWKTWAERGLVEIQTKDNCGDEDGNVTVTRKCLDASSGQKTCPMLECFGRDRDVTVHMSRFMRFGDLAQLNQTCRAWHTWMTGDMQQHTEILQVYDTQMPSIHTCSWIGPWIYELRISAKTGPAFSKLPIGTWLGCAFARCVAGGFLFLTQPWPLAQLQLHHADEAWNASYRVLAPVHLQSVLQAQQHDALDSCGRLMYLKTLQIDWSVALDDARIESGFRSFPSSLTSLTLRLFECATPKMVQSVMTHLRHLIQLRWIQLIAAVPQRQTDGPTAKPMYLSERDAQSICFDALLHLTKLQTFHFHVIHPTTRLSREQFQIIGRCSSLTELSCGSVTSDMSAFCDLMRADTTADDLHIQQDDIASGIGCLVPWLPPVQSPLRELYMCYRSSIITRPLLTFLATRMTNLEVLKPNGWNKWMTPDDWEQLICFPRLASLRLGPFGNDDDPNWDYLRAAAIWPTLLQCTTLTKLVIYCIDWHEGDLVALLMALKHLVALTITCMTAPVWTEFASAPPSLARLMLNDLYDANDHTAVDVHALLPPMPHLTSLRILHASHPLPLDPEIPVPSSLRARFPKLTTFLQ